MAATEHSEDLPKFYPELAFPDNWRDGLVAMGPFLQNWAPAAPYRVEVSVEPSFLVFENWLNPSDGKYYIVCFYHVFFTKVPK